MRAGGQSLPSAGYLTGHDPDNGTSSRRSTRLTWVVGGLRFGAEADEPIHLPTPYRSFLTAPGVDHPLVSIEVGDPTTPSADERPVVRGRVWRMTRTPTTWIVRVDADGRPFVRGEFDASFESGIVTAAPDYAERARREVAALPFPFDYPLGEVAVVGRIGCLDGALLAHACGVLVAGGVHLFLGQSGAGKTTTARLWESVPGATVLSDDRIVLREAAGTWMAHGTPWHGDARLASPLGAPVAGLHLLEHGPRPEHLSLSAPDALAELFRVSFQPFWDPAGTGRTLAALARLLAVHPCRRFRFPPTAAAVEHVLALSRS